MTFDRLYNASRYLTECEGSLEELTSLSNSIQSQITGLREKLETLKALLVKDTGESYGSPREEKPTEQKMPELRL